MLLTSASTGDRPSVQSDIYPRDPVVGPGPESEDGLTPDGKTSLGAAITDLNSSLAHSARYFVRIAEAFLVNSASGQPEATVCGTSNYSAHDSTGNEGPAPHQLPRLSLEAHELGDGPTARLRMRSMRKLLD